jgi:hypothetical protein
VEGRGTATAHMTQTRQNHRDEALSRRVTRVALRLISFVQDTWAQDYMPPYIPSLTTGSFCVRAASVGNCLQPLHTRCTFA